MTFKGNGKSTANEVPSCLLHQRAAALRYTGERTDFCEDGEGK